MRLPMIWKCATPPCIVRAAVAATVVFTSLQTAHAEVQIPTWESWSKESCDEVVELRAHARDGNEPFAVPARQELQEKVYFNSPGTEPVQVVGIYPLIDNKKVIADITLHASEVAPRVGVRRIYDWFPDDRSIASPAGPVAIALQPGPTTLMLELHYYNVQGEATTDKSGVALCLVRGAHLRAARAGVANFDVPNVHIPRNTKDHVVTRTCTVQSDQPVLLQFAAPGMHRLGTGFRWSIEPGNGAPPVTLERPYRFGERATTRLYPDPVVYRGDRITTTCTYWNPMDKAVEGGWRSEEEVCRMTVLFYPEADFICE